MKRRFMRSQFTIEDDYDCDEVGIIIVKDFYREVITSLLYYERLKEQ
jgi:hypothetical protein